MPRVGQGRFADAKAAPGDDRITVATMRAGGSRDGLAADTSKARAEWDIKRGLGEGST